MGRRDVRRRLEEVTGRRVETVEWGIRDTIDWPVMGARKGKVSEYGTNEAQARHVLTMYDRVAPGSPYARYMATCELVCRTVVTYTTGWDAAPGEQAAVPAATEDARLELF